MQRKKTFLVVCISIVFLGAARGQHTMPGLHTEPSGLTDRPLLLPVAHMAIPAWNAGNDPHWGLTRGWTNAPGGLSRVDGRAMAGPDVTGTGNLAAGEGIGIGATGLSAAGDKSDRPSLRTLENDYYTTHFGFFCQKELQFEKTTRIPLRFRLGSLEQCNYLEGKR